MLTEEHAPPAWSGGTVLALTCKPCNSESGRLFDGGSAAGFSWDLPWKGLSHPCRRPAVKPPARMGSVDLARTSRGVRARTDQLPPQTDLTDRTRPNPGDGSDV